MSTDANAPIPIPPMSRGRRIAAMVADCTGASELLRCLTGSSHGWPRIRAINYHQTMAANAERFENHLRYYQKRFAPVSHADLLGLLQRGAWPHKKPGLLISFDDGARSNYDVAAPLLDRYGFVGWFFAPAGFIDCPPPQQKTFARAHDLLAAILGSAPNDSRVAMSWDELHNLRGRGHIIGCHTMNHRRMSAKLSADELHTEIVESRDLMNERLGGGIDSFCWVGGEEGSYSAAAAKVIANADYRLGFMTNSEWITPQTDRLQLNRTNVEDRFSMSVMKLLISGVMDFRFKEYRGHINALTRVQTD